MTVYFVQKLRDDRSIKIGYVTERYTESLAMRISALPSECGVPIKLLGCIEGHVDDEQALHVRFGQHRIFGKTRLSEWFRPAPEILEFIEDECYLPEFFTEPKTAKVVFERQRYEELLILAYDLDIDLSELVNQALDRHLDSLRRQLPLPLKYGETA